MAKEIPKQLQHQIAQLQQMQQQAQAIIAQRQQLDLQLKETERAIDELQEIKKKKKPTIYQSVGALLIKTSRKKVEADLADRRETLELRIKTLGRQEEKLRKKIQETQQKVQKAMQKPSVT